MLTFSPVRFACEQALTPNGRRKPYCGYPFGMTEGGTGWTFEPSLLALDGSAIKGSGGEPVKILNFSTVSHGNASITLAGCPP